MKLKYLFFAVLVFEAITCYLVAVGAWPQSMAWVSLAAVALFTLWAEPYQALLLCISSIPFYLALPNPYFDSLSAWRPAFAWLVGIWVLKSGWARYQNNTWRQWPQEVRARLNSWDIYLVLFGVAAWMSVLLARFPGQSVRQLAFLMNAAFLYLVLINVARTRDQIFEVIKSTAVSLGLIVALGYVQFGSSLWANQYYFWQYWALLISKAYYGLGLANVLTYSNSWFSYTGGQPTLRMFSIMPDSHSFAVICVFFIGFLLAFLFAAQTRAQKIWLWLGILLTSWALILSGTRGVWVGLLAPALFALCLSLMKLGRPYANRFLAASLLVALVFVASPALSRGLDLIRSGLGGGHFLERVSSIYDLEEQSNAGRLIIWKDSVRYALRHPLGVGYGNFIVSLVPNIGPNDSYEQVAGRPNLRYNLPQKFVTAHSLYLNILVELGLVGVIIFFLIWWKYAQAAWQFLRQTRDRKSFLAAMATSGALVLLWLLAYGVFDLTIFNDKILIYTLVIMGVTGLIFRQPRDVV